MKAKDYAIEFDAHFCSDYYKTSSADSKYKIRYEASMPQIDHWINSVCPNMSNQFDNTAQKFKKSMFYHLKKMGWKPTKIKGIFFI